MKNLTAILDEKYYDELQNELKEMMLEAFKKDLDEYLESNYFFDYENALAEIQEEIKHDLRKEINRQMKEKQDALIKDFFQKLGI